MTVKLSQLLIDDSLTCPPGGAIVECERTLKPREAAELFGRIHQETRFKASILRAVPTKIKLQPK